MNKNMVLHILGIMLKINALLMSVPLLVSIIYRESSAISFLPAIILSFVLGYFLSKKMPEKISIYAREGIVIVVSTWICLSLIGAIPFYIGGHIPSYIDSFFETVSGFTTTGSSILTEIEHLPKGILFWRSFTHWIGGMGVLVFAMAILPKSNSRAMNILQAEMTGYTATKLVSRARTNSQILYGMYIALTILQIIFLMIGKMPFYDSVVTTFATAGTGGFAIKNASIAAYNSYYLDMVISIFMIIFGINFNMFFFLITKNIKEVLNSEELKYYFLIVIVATILICINSAHLYNNLSDNFRYTFFQVASIISTTGFSNAYYTDWPIFSQSILLLIMMIGSCAGSTAGGLKVSRIIIMFKSVAASIKKVIHPNWVVKSTLDKKPLDDAILRGIGTYMMIYMIIFAISTMLLIFLGLDMGTAFSAVNTCINNVGPGLGSIGPAGNFAHLGGLVKIILIFNMIAGRLELIPVIAFFAPSTWKK